MPSERLLQALSTLDANALDSLSLEDFASYKKSLMFGETHSHYPNLIHHVAERIIEQAQEHTSYAHAPFYMEQPIPYKYDSDRYITFFQKLIDRGLDLTATDMLFGQTSLGIAIGFDNTPAAIALIHIYSQHPDGKELLNKTDFFHAASSLLLAIQKGNVEVVQALLKTGLVDVNKPDRNGMTPLHWASAYRLDTVIDLLLQQGANPAARTFPKILPSTIKYSIEQKKLDSTEKLTSRDTHFVPNLDQQIGIKIPLAYYQMDSQTLAKDAAVYGPVFSHFNNSNDIFIQQRESHPMSSEVTARLTPQSPLVMAREHNIYFQLLDKIFSERKNVLNLITQQIKSSGGSFYLDYIYFNAITGALSDFIDINKVLDDRGKESFHNISQLQTLLDQYLKIAELENTLTQEYESLTTNMDNFVSLYNSPKISGPTLFNNYQGTIAGLVKVWSATSEKNRQTQLSISSQSVTQTPGTLFSSASLAVTQEQPGPANPTVKKSPSSQQ